MGHEVVELSYLTPPFLPALALFPSFGFGSLQFGERGFEVHKGLATFDIKVPFARLELGTGWVERVRSRFSGMC